MPVDLSKPLDWENASGDARALLQDLQGNILKGHGRADTANLFLNFGTLGDRKVRPILRSIGRQLPCALDQLRDAKAFNVEPISSGRFLAFYLTAAGYKALGATAASKQPDDPLFDQGMMSRVVDLNDVGSDGDLATFDPHFRQDTDVIHAMLLIAHDDETLVAAEAARWKILLSFGGIKVVGTETGLQHFDTAEEGIENFGYVDGRSQPLMLTQDIAKEAEKAGLGVPPVWTWDPTFPLGQVLVPDPGGAHPGASFGSYFVFRKLEQNVKGFKDAESEHPDDAKSLAGTLGLAGADRKRAGAMVVGRFEDGTPFVAPHDSATPPVGAINNFDFSNDADGHLCPFRGHIRKTNPRGESAALFGIDLDEERAHIMARRGITYGKRVQDADLKFTDRPTKDVGLLFMAYMKDIGNQFEFNQLAWANNVGFLKDGAGLDPVIGLGTNGPGDTMWPDGFGHPDKAEFDFANFVITKGGEYFFAPSKSFLTTL